MLPIHESRSAELLPNTICNLEYFITVNGFEINYFPIDRK